ncbi:MAG: SH3 domain-containing protein [Oscillospiraceae bacterium]|nr:SH3 domain-containing protein [Oscillospiraceae bacterium]
MLENEEDIEFSGWHACEIAGHETYVPAIFVCDGKLTRDYNPTELTPVVGDVLEVREIVCAWLFAENDEGVTGWIPAERVASVDV